MVLGINFRRQYNHQGSADELLTTVSSSKLPESYPVSVEISNDLIAMKVTEEIHRWWSPEMNLRIESNNETSTIHEVIGPNAATFTLAMFFIFLGAVVFIAAFIMMLAQIHLGMSSTLALVGTCLSVLVIVIALSGLAYGRFKAKDQVIMFRKIVQEIISPF